MIAPAPPHPREVFLSADLVFNRNREQGLTSIAEVYPDAAHVRLWNHNAMCFDVFRVIRQSEHRWGWVVLDDHPRWNLKPIMGND